MNSVSRRCARSVFVTGATGFIGTVLMKRLSNADARPIFCLVRKPGWTETDTRTSSEESRIVGDLSEPASYEAALAGVDTVVHMAAATGAAGPERIEAVNVRGTASLILACKRQKVRRIVYLSSIAATYPDLRDYPYGESKRRAEALVRESGMEYVIVRPTIVLGRLAPNWAMLRKLAGLPVVPLIGGGSARVQPVSVEDLATVLVAILDSPELPHREVEVGGPEVLTFGQFLGRIRQAAGRRGFPRVPLPAWPIRQLLRMVAAVARARIPVGPGQLVPFTADGIARPHPLTDELRPAFSPLDDLLKRLCDARDDAPVSQDSLRRECDVFHRYLIRRPPDDYVIRKYLAGVEVARRLPAPLPIDASLMSFASRGPRCARIADAYARFFRPHGLLRRKLLLLFAIIENSHGYEHFTVGASSRLPGSLARVAYNLGMFCIHLATGILIFGPRQLITGPKARP